MTRARNDRGGAGVVVALCTIIITLAVSGIRGVVAARQRVGFRGDDATFYLAAVSTLTLMKRTTNG
jgi:hypothetical protein